MSDHDHDHNHDDHMIPNSPPPLWDQIIPHYYYHHHHPPSEFESLYQHDSYNSSLMTTRNINTGGDQASDRDTIFFMGDGQTMLTPNTTTSSGTTLNPEIGSSSAGGGGGNPNPSEPIVSPKPARRRSRASRKAPTTLLSANLHNFRTLVQQYTGCHNSSSLSSQSSSMLFTNQGGPITLSFGTSSSQGDHIQANWHQEQEQQQYHHQGQHLGVSYNNDNDK